MHPTRAFTRDNKHPRAIASGSVLLINTTGMIGLIDRTLPPANYILRDKWWKPVSQFSAL